MVDSPVDEVVVVVGVMKDIVVEHVTDQYGHAVDLSFAEQEWIEGLEYSVCQVRSVIDWGRICIVLGDMLFNSDYGDFLTTHE